MNMRLVGSKFTHVNRVEWFLTIPSVKSRIWFVDTEDQKDLLDGYLLLLGVQITVEILDLSKGAVFQANGRPYCFVELCC
jgi:hypothetical protein